MKSAAEAALESYDGSTDMRSHIQGALESALEENGFDVNEVRSAMGSMGGGFSPMGAIASSAERDPAQLMQQIQSGQVAGTGDSMIQSFLEQFRAGLEIDVVS